MKQFTYYFILAILCLFLSQMVSAQITLRLVDKVTTAPIAFASVECRWNETANNQPNTLQFTTDKNGLCTIADEAIKNQATIVIKHITYGEYSFSINQITQAQNTLYLQPQQVNLNQTVITATKESTPLKSVARYMEVINRNQIAFSSSQNTADLVFNETGAYIQKSQQGGGSVILRGFEANRVLLMVDGVRMNNAIYRAGHLQNILRVDQFMLDRVEVLYGPGSVNYGSDAIGGVVQLFSRNPVLLQQNDKKIHIKSEAAFRYSSANNEYTSHLNFNIANKKIGLLSGFTQSNFGNVVMGRNRTTNWENVGLRPTYVSSVDGKDILINNPNQYEQVESGYKQTDMYAKILYKPGENTEHILNTQYSFTNNVPRYDRLTDPTTTGLKSAEWYYGPEKRLLASYQFKKKTNGSLLMDNFNNIIAYQFIEESRIDRGFGSTSKNFRTEKLNIWSNTFIASKNIGQHHINYGFDIQYNQVKSSAYKLNITNGIESPQSTRYPEGGSTMINSGIFINHQIPFGKWILNDAVRYSFIHTDAKFGESVTFYSFLPATTSQNNPALNGNLGLIYLLNNNNRLYANISNAFRAPNVDDLNKLFDTQNSKVTLPNTKLAPEKSITGEIGTNINIKRIIAINTALYYTSLYDAIIVQPTTVNGNDSILYNNKNYKAQTLVNTRNAYVYGNNSSIQIFPHKSLTIYGDINYTFGRIVSSGTETPLDHIPPMYGKAGAKLMIKHFQVDAFVRASAAKVLSDYNLEGEDNLSYATTNGMPSWYTLNIKTQYNHFFKGTLFVIQSGIENILDTHYRLFASGISAPGRNVYVSLRISL